MAQHDYVIANGTGAAVRSDINNGLAAIVTQNSGATEPTTTYAYMRWADTTAGVMKMRNGANSAWITLYQLDGEWSTIAFENGTAAAPSIYFKDSGTDTGFYSPGANQVGISTGGTARLTIDSNGNVDIDSNTLYVDATNNRVGLGTSSPSNTLHVSGTAGTPTVFERTGTTGVFVALKDSSSQTFIGNTNGVFSIQTPGSSYSDKLVVTSAGNVGIGNNAPDNTLSLGAVGSIDQDANSVYIGNNFTSTGVNFKKTGNYAQQLMFDTATGSLIYKASASTGTAGNAITFSERFRCDSAGRFLVGTSSAIGGAPVQIAGTGDGLGAYRFSASAGDEANISLFRSKSGTVGTNTAVANNDSLGAIYFNGANGSSYNRAAGIAAEVDGTVSGGGAGDMPGRLVFSTTADGASSPTERMRITNGGSVIVGDTQLRDLTGQQFQVSGWSMFYQTSSGTTCSIFTHTGSGTQTAATFRQGSPAATVGSITISGGTATAYNTSSDYRLKENIVPLVNASNRLKQLKPSQFNFISAPDRTVDGFLAHEAQAVVPECVTGSKDEVDADGNPVYQGIDQSKLVPLLTAALQEAIGRIETLEAEVAALKGA
jgi:hypothetical protein